MRKYRRHPYSIGVSMAWDALAKHNNVSEITDTKNPIRKWRFDKKKNNGREEKNQRILRDTELRLIPTHIYNLCKI